MDSACGRKKQGNCLAINDGAYRNGFFILRPFRSAEAMIYNVESIALLLVVAPWRLPP